MTRDRYIVSWAPDALTVVPGRMVEYHQPATVEVVLRPTLPDPVGIRCPACGGETGVTETRTSGPNLRRRRKCNDCGHRVTTIETIVHGR